MAAGEDDIYWNSFMPAFFEKMGAMIRKDMTAAVSAHGLTSAHSIYLIALNIHDGQTLVGLSKFLDLDPANTNRIVKVLKDKELVYDDRRTPNCKKYSIFLTETGKKLSDSIMDDMCACNSTYFRGIPEEDVIFMRNTLIKVLKNMGAEASGHDMSKKESPFYTNLQTIPLDNYRSD